MTISLKKNEGINLSKATDSLSTIVMGLGWDAFLVKEVKSGGFLGFGGNKTGQTKKVPMDVDLDASCVLVDDNAEIVENIFFGNKVSRCRNVVHTGDNTTGDGDGDDEQIKVNLEGLSERVKYVVFTVNAYSNGVSFDNVENAFCRLFDGRNEQEIVRTELDASGGHNAIIMAIVTRVNGEWQFKSHLVPARGRTSSELIPDIRRILGA